MPLLIESLKGHHFIDKMQEVHFNRPCVVERTSFIVGLIAQAEITILEELPEGATDEEFLAFWNDHDKDRDAAVANFMAKFQEPEPVKKPAPKRRKPAAKKEG